MDSSPVLRQQSQNEVNSGFQRMTNKLNKIPSHQKSFKLLSAIHSSNQQTANKDPGNSETGRKAPVKGVSRLPVLAKSLRLQTPSDFNQSHCRWEEKPLAGKIKKKKPCTRPVPFNLSQPKSSRTVNENQQPVAVSQPRTGTRVVQPVTKGYTDRLKPPNTHAKPTKYPATFGSNVGSSKGTGTSNGKAAEHISQLPRQSGPSTTFKTSATLSQTLASIPNNALLQNSAASAHNSLNADACLDNMNLLSLKDPSKTSHTIQNMQQAVQGKFSKCPTEKGENFQRDHAALLSILRNEGVRDMVLGSATPQSKPYNYVPQRVSVMKSRQKAASTTGSIKSVPFSPDSGALQSALQNEGVKGGGLVGATPRNSACPPGRSTSIYTAQRVPVKKNLAEGTGGPVALERKETPLQKWTPQRVRNTRHQPISAMKWHLSTQQSPYISTPGLQSYKASLHLRQEEVVQRLFDDQEEEPSKKTEEDPETQREQLSAQSKTTKSLSEEKAEASASSNDEKEQRVVRLRPFIQAQERESVIFFSTGKKLLRGPPFEQHESSTNNGQRCLMSSERREAPPARTETSAGAETTCQINPSAQSLHRVVMLRKRLPPLDELRMDEEVATYTSVSVSAALGFLPPQPRCGNPLASTLHFEDSTKFVPIGLDLSSGSSPLSSPLQDR